MELTFEKDIVNEYAFQNLSKDFLTYSFSVDFEKTTQLLAEIIFGNQKYDSIDSYNILFDGYSDGEIQKNALDIIERWDPKNQLGLKYGQDCYDIVFRLQKVLPKEAKPQIVATNNTDHTEGDQQKYFTHYHFGTIITDSETGNRYLIDWIDKPIELYIGNTVLSKGGDVLTVKNLEDGRLILSRYIKRKDVSRAIEYDVLGMDFDIEANFKSFLRIKNRVNQFTKPTEKPDVTFYIKYNSDKVGFETNVPGLINFIPVASLLDYQNTIDNAFEFGVTEKLNKFAHIHKNLPEDFWLK